VNKFRFFKEEFIEFRDEKLCLDFLPQIEEKWRKGLNSAGEVISLSSPQTAFLTIKTPN